MEIGPLVEMQRIFFESGKTKELSFRREALKRLEKGILQKEGEICAALTEDLKKSPAEGYMTEIGMVLSELSFMEKNFEKWAAPKRVPTPLAQFHAKSFTLPEPYGVALILSPWNYPFQLSMAPLVGAIGAGNCAVVKPSAYAPATSRVIGRLIADCFDPSYIAVVEGGREENSRLLEEVFDYIFFTGGVEVGKLVMEKAARHLTPVSLELGGKSPCIVDETANIAVAARRIVFGKFLNAGQTCIAPDYLLVQSRIQDKLIDCIKKEITAAFGDKPLENPDYPKIVNEKHFSRLLGLLKGEQITFGGESNDRCQIAPTIVTGATSASPLMQEEIFGPILLVLPFEHLTDAITFVKRREKPLALYLFTQTKEAEERILKEISFGGGCINDTIIHLATSRMPFGGVGQSGMGSYHGKASFDTFSHTKSMVKKYNWIDLPIRYQPYTSRKERLLRLFLK